MRAHWAFVGTGESQYGTENKKNQLLPRAYVLSHFSKHVTGSTRLNTTSNIAAKTEGEFESSAYIKGDSLIVMAIDTTSTGRTMKLMLPCKVKSGVCLRSTSNESLCQEVPLTIDEPVQELLFDLPPRSLNTFIFMIDNGSAAIGDLAKDDADEPIAYYDLRGRRLLEPKGLCIERFADGSTKKVLVE